MIMNELKYGRNIRLLLQRYTIGSITSAKEAIPDSYDKYQASFIIAWMLWITASKNKMLKYWEAWAKILIALKNGRKIFS